MGYKKLHKKGSKQKSIILDLSLRLGIVIIVLLLVLGLISYYSVSTDSVKSYSQNMSGIVPVYANTIDGLNQKFINELHVYTKSDLVADGDIEGIISWIRKNENRRSSDFSGVFFCGLDKMAHSDEGKDIDLSDRSYVKEMLKEGTNFYISQPVQSKLDNTFLYTVSAAAYDKNNHKIGFFAGTVSLSHLQKMSETINVGKNGYMSIFDESGVCLVSPYPDYI
jgi:methyl-accepting chemotaxis protein